MEKTQSHRTMLLSSSFAALALMLLVTVAHKESSVGTDALTGQAYLNRCHDSDGGITPEVQGTITALRPNGRIVYSWSDYCESGRGLVEYHCTQSSTTYGFRMTTKPCTCRDGACVEDAK